MSGFDLLLVNFFNLRILRQVYPLLLQGLEVTALLVAVTVTLGLVAGLAIAVGLSLSSRAISRILRLYVDFIRSFPPLVLLIVIYYALPFMGLRLHELPAAVLALTLNSSGYYGEIFRAGIESVPRGQVEAARSTGLSALQTMAYVVLPQAIRNVVAPLTTNTLELIKTTSVASAVALPEFLRTARIAQDLTYSPTPLIVVALTYFVLLWPLVRLVSRLERQMISSR